jgi:hypothetical protein
MDLVRALNENKSVALAYWIGILIGAAVLMVFWFNGDIGPGHPLLGLLLTIWTAVLTAGLAVPVLRRIPAGWCRVPQGERLLHSIFGVRIFSRLLELSGWNRRNVYPAWGYSITKARLPVRARAAQAGGGAHAACFAIHSLLAAVALFTGHYGGALWILLPGVVVHLYPVLLQRSIMLRLQPLMDKYREAKDPLR